MKITLKDGTTYNGADNSTTQEMIIFVSDVYEFVEVYNKMTDGNLSEYHVGDSVAYGRTLMETKTYKWSDKLEAHFVAIPTEAQAVIDEMGRRAEASADKAEGYDILTGGE